jgi:hypothetical protein
MLIPLSATRGLSLLTATVLSALPGSPARRIGTLAASIGKSLIHVAITKATVDARVAQSRPAASWRW